MGEDKDMDTGDKSVKQNFLRGVITSLKGFTTSKGFTSFVDGTKKVYGVIKVKTGSWARDGYSAVKHLFERKTASCKLVCTNCGHRLSNGEQFCSACGTKMPPPQETTTAAESTPTATDESTPNASPAEPVVPKIGSNVKIKIRKKERVVPKASLTASDPASIARSTPASAPAPAPAAEPAPAPVPAPAAEPAPAPAAESAPTPAAAPVASVVTPVPASATVSAPPSGEKPTDNSPPRHMRWSMRKVQPDNPGKAAKTDYVASLQKSEERGAVCFFVFGVGATLGRWLLAWGIWKFVSNLLDADILLFYLPAAVLIPAAISEGLLIWAIYAATVTSGRRGAVKALQGWLIVVLAAFVYFLARGTYARKEVSNMFQSLDREVKKEVREFERESRRQQDDEEFREWQREKARRRGQSRGSW